MGHLSTYCAIKTKLIVSSFYDIHTKIDELFGVLCATNDTVQMKKMTVFGPFCLSETGFWPSS